MEQNENKPCELNEDDIGIELNFITIVPYVSDDSDFDWHRRNSDVDEDSTLTHSNEKPHTKKLKKKRASTSERNNKIVSYRDFTKNTNETESADDDEDSINILRGHRNLIAASTPKATETSELYKRKESTLNLNNSYPSTFRPSPINRNISSVIPPYVTPFRRTQHDPMYRNLSNDYSNFSSDYEVEPTYKNYQFLGDSQLLRFSDKILSLRPLVIHHGDQVKIRYRGYCVSGQTIQDLENLLIKREHKLSNKVIVLIGTNDFMKNNDFESMYASYNSIVRYLKIHAEHIVLLTVPPIPRIRRRESHWLAFRKFNDYIVNLAEPPLITVIDIAQAFIGYENSTQDLYYEQYYKNTERVDMIHLNTKGFLLLKSLLDIHLFNS